MAYHLLESINMPDDLKKLDYRELEQLCGEIRSFLIEKVSCTGGHLSSNLGVIELTVALHYSLNLPQDKLVFDVGHQSYTHKLLTGRRELFDKLRCEEGISGFPNPRESEYDSFGTGHGSTSISAAVGLARAKKLSGDAGLVVAIIGDGALTGGMVYEAINNIDSLNNLVVILNDNTMSISKNVGALAHYLTGLRTSPGYYRAKKDVKAVLDSTPVIGDGVIRGIQGVKAMLRKNLYHTTFFENMGLRYVGPVDGHDLTSLCNLFSDIGELRKPMILHVETKKGKGFSPAEKNPGAFHATAAFNARRPTNPDIAPSDSFSTVFGQKLAALADEDPKLCAITAAMKYGTGLQYMKKNHLERFFDVGMAEEHAVTYAAGLAAGGMHPVLAIYSTFLQRGYDQILHDVVLDNYNVLFAVDRAGLVPGDGQTHQGLYDAAFLSQRPELTIVAPGNYTELEYWLEKLVREYSGPRAIRYPRGKEPDALAGAPCSGKPYDRPLKHKGAKLAIVSYGTQVVEAVTAAKLLKKDGIPADVFKLVVINPLPAALLKALAAYPFILFVEEGIAPGGIGEHLGIKLAAQGWRGSYAHHAVCEANIPPASVESLRLLLRLDASSVAQEAEKLLRRAPTEAGAL